MKAIPVKPPVPAIVIKKRKKKGGGNPCIDGKMLISYYRKCPGKKPTKKATPKKATPKKATPKKATPKKATPPKAPPKKEPRKVAPLLVASPKYKKSPPKAFGESTPKRAMTKAVAKHLSFVSGLEAEYEKLDALYEKMSKSERKKYDKNIGRWDTPEKKKKKKKTTKKKKSWYEQFKKKGPVLDK